jgi:hypothetical protein
MEKVYLPDGFGSGVPKCGNFLELHRPGITRLLVDGSTSWPAISARFERSRERDGPIGTRDA